MDTPTPPLSSFEAGAGYLAALEDLGLCPNALFRAFDRVADAFVLVLVTDAYDAVGPLALSTLLFMAYNVEATCRAIDSFVVRLHGPSHRFVAEIENRLPGRLDARVPRDGPWPATQTGDVISADGLEIDEAWIYRLEKPVSKGKTADILRRWHRFETKVNRLAA